jgi:hypothetical protein
MQSVNLIIWRGNQFERELFAPENAQFSELGAAARGFDSGPLKMRGFEHENSQIGS